MENDIKKGLLALLMVVAVLGIGYLISVKPIKVVAEGEYSPPTLISTFNTGGGTNINDVFAHGVTAYVATKNAAGASPELYLFDISRPASPQQKSSLNIGATIQKIFVAGNYAFLATHSDAQEIVIVNVSNKQAPAVAGSFNLPSGSNATALSIFDNKLYAGTVSGYFYVLDITSTTTPVLIGSYNIGSAVINDIAVSGTRAYLATSKDAKEIIALDISNPSSITQAASFAIAGSPNAASLDYNLGKLYVVTNHLSGRPDFYVFDVSQPSDISLLGSVELGPSHDSVSVYYDLAFVGTKSSTEGLITVDITNPANPSKILSFNTGAAVAALSTNSDRIYAASLGTTRKVSIVDPHYLEKRAIVSDVDGDGTYKIGCLGDSNTNVLWWSGNGWCEQLQSLINLPNWTTHNYAWPSVTACDTGRIWYGASLDASSFVRKILQDLNPDHLVLAYGTADILLGKQPLEVVGCYENLKNIALADGVPSLITITSPRGTATDGLHHGNISELNEGLLRYFSRSELVDFYNDILWPDDFLPNDEIHMNNPGQTKHAQNVYDKFFAGQ